MGKIVCYKSVFKREFTVESTFETMVENPLLLLSIVENKDWTAVYDQVKNIKDKIDRNIFKRENLPAVDISRTGYFSIDIDNISSNSEKEALIEKLKPIPGVRLIQESVSGNIVVYFKYKCSIEDYPYLYYKVYLELTLALGKNIDFLPEIGRLRYVSLGEVFFENKDPETLTEILRVENLPYINTQVGVKESRRVVYGSR